MPRARSRRSSSAVWVSASIWIEHLRGLRRIALRQLAGEPSLDGERDELLLGAVMDVALQATPLFVLRGDQTLA